MRPLDLHFLAVMYRADASCAHPGVVSGIKRSRFAGSTLHGSENVCSYQRPGSDEHGHAHYAAAWKENFEDDCFSDSWENTPIHSPGDPWYPSVQLCQDRGVVYCTRHGGASHDEYPFSGTLLMRPAATETSQPSPDDTNAFVWDNKSSWPHNDCAPASIYGRRPSWEFGWAAGGHFVPRAGAQNALPTSGDVLPCGWRAPIDEPTRKRIREDDASRSLHKRTWSCGDWNWQEPQPPRFRIASESWCSGELERVPFLQRYFDRYEYFSEGCSVSWSEPCGPSYDAAQRSYVESSAAAASLHPWHCTPPAGPEAVGQARHSFPYDLEGLHGRSNEWIADNMTHGWNCGMPWPAVTSRLGQCCGGTGFSSAPEELSERGTDSCADYVSLWAKTMCNNRGDIRQLALHLWDRVRDSALRQVVFNRLTVLVACFWISLKLLHSRRHRLSVRGIKNAIKLPIDNLHLAELATMQWLEWRPLKHFLAGTEPVAR